MTSDAQQADAPATATSTASVGDELRAARLAQQLTLEQLSTDLRIEARQLLALEENRFEQIGVPVFVKGYLRQYGHRLGLDVGDLLERYHKHTNLTEIQIQPSRTIKLHDERQVTFWVLAIIVLVGVVVGVALWWWDDGTFRMSLTSSLPATGTTTEAPSPTEGGAAPVAVPAAAAVATSVSSSPAVEAATAAVEPAPADAAATVTAAAEPGVSPAADAAAPGAAASPNAQVALVLTFSNESWAEVTDARGERLFYGLGAAGQRVDALGEPPFTVVLGNAEGVQLMLDGAPYPVPAEGRQGNLARFTVDVAEE